MRDRRRNDTLNKIIETTIKIDDRLYERAIERRRGVGFQAARITLRGGRYHGPTRDPYRYTPMELDFIALKKRRKPRGGPRKKLGDFSYYAYSKKGYIAKNYRSKNKV